MTELASLYIHQPQVKPSVRILLVDDQRLIGESIRQMVEAETDIIFHYCQDPTEAIKIAEEVKPTVILQDLVMPEIDGLTLVKYFRAAQATRDIPLIVLSTKEEAASKAECFAAGANDYLVKLPDRVEFLARVRYHSNAYLRLLERNAAYVKLKESQEMMQRDLDEAALYVLSLLPDPIGGAISTSWVYAPSASLGGDAFGYHWIDEDRFALYLLDVCGHGVGAALLSITVMNVLRLMPDAREPKLVLKALNEAFPMESHGDRFFTMWYGVYNKQDRVIRYASAGHPPALLKNPDGSVQRLETKGFIIGGFSDSIYFENSTPVLPGSIIYLFSDGVFELNPQRTFSDFTRDIAEAHPPLTVESIREKAHVISNTEVFDDDFSIVRVAFQ